MFYCSKTYGHDIGLSCAFRQWRSNSHCNKVHGYALKVKIVFKAKDLDNNNWVIDFGSLKEIKKLLQDNFDHRTIIARDDPELSWFKEAHKRGILNLRITDKVGCEAFALSIYTIIEQWLISKNIRRVNVDEVEVSEHGANSAAVKDI